MAATAYSNGPKSYNEWQDTDGRLRPHYEGIARAVEALSGPGLAERWGSARRQVALDAFTFYLDPRKFRPAPADWLPRVIPIDHWEVIASGVAQRIRAINRFLLDLDGDGQDVVPEDVMYTSQHFYPEVQGFRPPKDVFVHIYGIDLVHWATGATWCWRTTFASPPESATS